MQLIFRGGPPFHSGAAFSLEPSFVGVGLSLHITDHDAEDKKSEGFLWGVPKKRVPLERRWCKQMGAENWYWKMLIPKYNIRICDTCGHHYEAKHLCRNCYEKVKRETEEIRKKVESDIGNNVEDKGVIVLYENERQFLDSSKVNNQMLVEIPKARPAWFTSNLLQKTTAESDPITTTITTTKPNLG